MIYLSSFDHFTMTITGQLISALLGTIGFAILFGIPRNHYLSTGAIGVAGWLVYILLQRYCGSGVVECNLAATIVVCIFSRIAARMLKAPNTIFIIGGIFPLVPGGGIFWTAYYLVSNQLHLALQSGFTAIKVVFAIVLGIVLVSALPAKFFNWNSNR